jgi:hypothetical protein
MAGSEAGHDGIKYITKSDRNASCFAYTGIAVIFGRGPGGDGVMTLNGELRDDLYIGRGIKPRANGDRYDGLWRNGGAIDRARLVTAGMTYDRISNAGCLRGADERIADEVAMSSHRRIAFMSECPDWR